ncbi:DUF1513 domain-containing protein [Psychrobacter alimentarius]|uniref:DUF1513 domain-containing protein n=1 Tax=Psychrobacter alimentarius TaxID=261164 RepID=UPI0019198073|nr:DUF1513 domain-containing protein [Psychrobacter alimentarius]
MHIIEATPVQPIPETSDKSSGSGNSQVKEVTKQLANELLVTSALTLIGTGVLVGIHHRYRKQQHPDASLQDYVTGICSQFRALPSVSRRQLSRLGNACQQATIAWQRAYCSDSLADDGSGRVVSSDTTNVSAAHTTTILPRPVCWVSGVASMPKSNTALQDTDDAQAEGDNNVNDFGVVGIDADRQIVWQTTMPERVHDIVVQPIINVQDKHNNVAQSRDVIVMGRRPSERFWVLEAATGQVKAAINALDNRHFYGHACYSLDGKWLYVTENDTVSLNGKIGLYDAQENYKKIAEFDSHGIGPHELIMHPDGKTLVIANGGIKTEQASREELNLDTMRPSLVYLDRYDGSLLEQIEPEHNQMSVRHLAMHDNGTVMIGIQFQGDKHINVPLVLTHKRGDTDFCPLRMPHNQWQRFHQYIASVAVDSARNQLCVTTPIGGCAALFDLNTYALIDSISLPDCAGATLIADSANIVSKSNNQHKESGFIVSDGQGQLTTLHVNHVSLVESDTSNDTERVWTTSQLHKMSFDNHLQAVL